MASQAWQPEHTNPAVSQAGRRIRKCHVSKEIISIFSPGKKKAESKQTPRVAWWETGQHMGTSPPSSVPLQMPRVQPRQGQMDFTVYQERKGRVTAHEP